MPDPDGSAAGRPAGISSAADFERALAQDYLGYLVSTGLVSLGGLLLLPLITAYLSPAEIGLYSLIETAHMLGITISLLGMKFAYLYFFAHANPADRAALLGTAMFLTVGAGAAIGALLWTIFASAPLLALFNAPVLAEAWLLVPLLALGAANTILITELRAERRVAAAGVIAVAQLVVWLAASTALVMAFGLGLPGLLGGQCIGLAVANAVALASGHRPGRFGFAPAQIGPLLRYGTPLMVGLVLRYGLDSLCRFLLAALVSIEAAGGFLIAMRMALLFEGLLAIPFFTAWGGLVHHALKRPEAAAVVGRVTGIALAASGVMILLLVAAQPPLFALLAGAPMPDLAGVFALILLGKAVLVVKSPLTAGMLIGGRTGWAVDNNLQSLAVFALVAWPAIHGMGVLGAAAALLAANLLPTLWLARQAGRRLRLRIEPAALGVGATAAAGGLACSVIGPLPAVAIGAALAIGLGLGARVWRSGPLRIAP